MSDNHLHAVQRRRGATFPDANRPLPFAPPDAAPKAIHFGDAGAELRAAREAAAAFDLSDRAQIAITGRDRVKFLHNFCTADIKSLAPGQGCEAFVTNVKGRVLAHVFVFAEDDALTVETVAESEAPLLAHLDRYIITEDVRLTSRTADFAELYVSGPNAAAALHSCGLGGEELAVNSHRSPRPGVSIRRVDWFDVPGFLLSVPRDELADRWGRCVQDAATAAGSHAFHALRIASRFPLYGTDVTDERIAQEVARTEQAINFRKGCYLGQEPIARLDALGHVNRELRGVTLDTDALPTPGSPIVDDDGQEIGSITSTAIHPTDSRAIALAYIRRPLNTPGSSVQVRVGEELHAAKVY
jgi:folate-binding protein YgfZ